MFLLLQILHTPSTMTKTQWTHSLHLRQVDIFSAAVVLTVSHQGQHLKYCQRHNGKTSKTSSSSWEICQVWQDASWILLLDLKSTLKIVTGCSLTPRQSAHTKHLQYVLRLNHKTQKTCNMTTGVLHLHQKKSSKVRPFLGLQRCKGRIHYHTGARKLVHKATLGFMPWSQSHWDSKKGSETTKDQCLVDRFGLCDQPIHQCQDLIIGTWW